MKGFLYAHRVTYAECTLGNHIYYSRYLDIMEAARGEYFRQLEVPLLQWQLEGIIFPVIECRIRYKTPARYDDLLSCEVWPNYLGRVRLNFSYLIQKEAGKPVIEAETIHACAGLDEKPRRIPEKLDQLLQPHLRTEKLLTQSEAGPSLQS